MKALLKNLLARRKFVPGDIISRSSVTGTKDVREVAMVLPHSRGVIWLTSPFPELGSISRNVPFEDFQILPYAWEDLLPSWKEKLSLVKKCFVTKAPRPSFWEYPIRLLGVPFLQRCLPPGPGLTWSQWSGWQRLHEHFAYL